MKFSLFFFYLVIFIIFYLNIHFNKSKKVNSLVTLCIIALTLLPFFFLGPFSAIGGYDEQDGQLAWYWSLLNNEEGKTFLHGYAGGTNIKNGFISGNEIFSLYKLLIAYLPDWIASTLFKLLGLLLLYLGIYHSSRKIFNLNPVESSYIAIFGTTTSFIPYIFALGGYGWSLGILSWVPLIYIFEDNIYKLYLKAALLGILAAISSEFLLLTPLAVYFYFLTVILFFLLGKFSFNIHQIGAAFLTISIFGINFILGGLELVNIWDFSARFIYEPYSLNTTSSELFYDKALSIYSAFRRPPHFFIILTLSFIFILSFRDKKFLKILSILAFLSFMLPYLIATLSIIYDVPIIKSFRWEQLVYSAVIGTPFLLMIFFNNLKKSYLKTNFMYFLALVSISSTSINSTIAFDNFNARGGHAIKTIYSSLPDILENEDLYRVVTTNYKPPPNTPIFYGIETLDGMRISSGIRRAFFFKILNNKKELHTHRHTIIFKNDKFQLDLLKMSNVAYLISSNKLEMPGTALFIGKIGGLRIKEIDNPFIKMIPAEISSLSAARDMYIYNLKDPWPRVFSGNVIRSSFSFQDRRFFEEIIEYGDEVTAFSKEDIIKFELKEILFENAEIQSFKQTKNGFEVQLNKSGLVTINQEYNPMWKAYCENKEIRIIPSNGIMMSINVPIDCKKIKLKSY